MKVALIQINAGSNKKANINKAKEKVQIAADQNTDFILLPEVFNYRGPLSGQELYNEIAEEIPGESLLSLMNIAKNNKLFILAGSIYERAEDKSKIYNTSVLIDDSGIIIGKYRKINVAPSSKEEKCGKKRFKWLKLACELRYDLHPSYLGYDISSKYQEEIEKDPEAYLMKLKVKDIVNKF